jgi:hypothetical protein
MAFKDKNKAMRDASVTLTSLNKEVRRSLDSMGEGASTLANRRTSVVAGVLGGAGLSAIAYVAATFVPGLQFIVLGPIAITFGIAAGILCVRGFRPSDEERRGDIVRLELEKNEQAARMLYERIVQLPPGTPKMIRDELWQGYLEVSQNLIKMSSSSSPLLLEPPGKSRLEGLVPRPQLPAPEDSSMLPPNLAGD